MLGTELETILIVEDDIGVATLEKRRLERSGYGTILAETADVALQRLEQSNVDLILLDNQLPDGVEGLDFFNDIRARGYEQPVILVTGYSNESMIIRCLRAGVDDFVSKSSEYLDYLPEAVQRVLHNVRTERILKESQKQLRMLGTAIEQETSAIVITTSKLDPPGPQIVFVNPAFERLTGYSKEEIIGKTPRMLQGPDTDRSTLDRLRSCLVCGETFEGEIINYRKDGTPYWLGWHVGPVRDEDGTITHFVSVQKDVTQQRSARKAEEQLALATALRSEIGSAFNEQTALQEILQQCADALVSQYDAAVARIWTINMRQDILELRASAGMYTHLDGNHSRIPVGQFKIGLIAKEKRPHLTNDFLHDPRVSNPEWARREGIVAFAGYPLICENQLAGVLGVFGRHPFDEEIFESLAGISDFIAQGILRKQAEQHIRDQAALIDQANDAILVIDLEDRILSWNKGAERLYGWHADEVLGKTGRELLYKTVPPSLQDVHRATVEMGEWQGELQQVAKDGRDIVVQSHRKLLLDYNNKPKAKLVINTDITEKKKLESQFLQAQKMEAIGRLAGGIAHDFNNLLTVITGYPDLILQNERLSDNSRDMLLEVHKAGDRAARLTRQLLAFSRKQMLELVPVELNSLVKEMHKMMRRLIGEHIQFECVCEPGLRLIKADPGQIEQVLVNLIVNASDAMPNGGQLTLETKNVDLEDEDISTRPERQSGAYVLIAVSDTGTGMDAATQNQIFEPFFTTKEVGKGTGLGLATVYGIVKQSGGFIYVYSELGRGTTFKIYLPILSETEGKVKRRSAEIRMPRGTETILLVEDEEAVRAMTALTLRTLGYTVLEAEAGEHALEQVKANGDSIDLIVTDVVMPKMSGRELVQHIQKNRPEMKILFLSGYTDDTVVRHGILERDVAFLQKPYSPAALARKVREVFNQTIAEAARNQPSSGGSGD